MNNHLRLVIAFCFLATAGAGAASWLCSPAPPPPPAGTIEFTDQSFEPYYTIELDEAAVYLCSRNPCLPI